MTDITRTLWQPDEQSVPDHLFKTEPTIAKLEMPSLNETSNSSAADPSSMECMHQSNKSIASAKPSFVKIPDEQQHQDAIQSNVSAKVKRSEEK